MKPKKVLPPSQERITDTAAVQAQALRRRVALLAEQLVEQFRAGAGVERLARTHALPGPLVEQVLRSAWNWPPCSLCGQRPERGGKRPGSALCQTCWEFSPNPFVGLPKTHQALLNLLAIIPAK